MPEITRPPRLGWRPLAGLGMLVLAVAFGGWQFARAEERNALDTRFTELTAIGQLKVHQISEWRNERLRGARMLSREPLFAALASRWAAAPDDEGVRREVRAHLAVLHRDLGYGDAILATPDGARWVSAAGDHGRLHAETQRIMNESVASRDAILSDFYRCPDCGEVHIEAAGPIVVENGRGVAILVLRSDPQLTLYPLLRQWPTTSESAETLLVRREGSEVVFLNTRRDAGAALTTPPPRPPHPGDGGGAG